VLADTAATVPLGVLLALGSRRISLFRIAVPLSDDGGGNVANDVS
jgi:hypothetical protein